MHITVDDFIICKGKTLRNEHIIQFCIYIGYAIEDNLNKIYSIGCLFSL
jgi:hypothetical protein